MIVSIAALVVLVMLFKPWNLRWKVERGLPQPVVILSQDASTSPIKTLTRSIESISVEVPKEEGSARDGAFTEENPVSAIDPKLFRASYTDSSNFMVGYKDAAGAVAIQPRFEWGGPFEEGKAKVEFEGRFGIIDKDGQFVVAPEYESIFDFVDGIAVAQKDGWFFFIDTTGRPVSDERFDYAWPHKEGLALVKRDGRFGYADATGQLVVATNLEETFGFNEGLAVAKVGGLFGLIDKRGRWAVTPQYDYAWPVEKGSVLVRKNGETSAIDVSSFTEPTTK
ncbi:MAG: WG repeat-containing protein [Bdellovibrionota bacterium]